MSRRRLTAADVEAAVLGGAILGGGGGGWIADGLERGRLAVSAGVVELVSLEEVPPDALLVTAAMVGAPSPAERFVRPEDFTRCARMLAEYGGVRAGGFIANENGAAGTVNGWLQAAALGVPVVDAPCNGRAHPTGVMGAMGLHRQAGYTSRQAAAGGNPAAGRYVEVYATGALVRTAAVTRFASMQAGGLVAVARDPVPVAYAAAHAAPGAVTQALALGEAVLAARRRRPDRAVEAAAEALRGEVFDEGTVERAHLEVAGGYDVGAVVVAGRRGRHTLTFWNEYMTVETDGERRATFPDLISTLSPADATPLATAEIAPGMAVALLVVPRTQLILGAGMRDPELFRDIEAAVGKEVVRHVF